MLSRFFAADFDDLCEGGFCRGFFFFVLVGSATGEFSSPPKDSLYYEEREREREGEREWLLTQD